MADERRNPLLGAFRAPVPGVSPPGVTAKPPASGPAAPGKPGEGKKPDEPPKAPAAGPVKPEGEKKPDEPPKVPTAGPSKPEGEKKPAEPPKAPAAGPAKPEGEKKPTEPPKPPTADPAKPEGEKKPPEPPKAPVGERTAEGPKGSTVTEIFDDRLDAPTEADLFDLPIPEEGDVFSMALHPAYFKDFLDHPFSVNRETQDYKDLFESIKSFGVQEPVKCRPGRNGGVEIISGHRRHDIAMQLNYPVPTLIQQIDEDDAQIQCVDGNLHRKDIPLSELARAAQMKMDALKRKAGRRSKMDVLEGKGPMKRSDELVGEDLGMSRASVQRLVRVNQLEEPLKKMVDKKELPLDTAEQVSHLKPHEQKVLANAIEKEGGTVPSKTTAVKLKEESKAGKLTPEKIEKSVAPTKREINPPLKVTLNDEDLRPYMPENATVPDAKRIIFEGLDMRKKALERKAAKEKAEKEAAKGAGEKKPVTTAR